MITAETKLSNPDAERALLGSLLIHPGHYATIRNTLRAEDFSIHRHRWIWEAIGVLSESQTPIDILTLTTELQHSGHSFDTGGAAYLTELAAATPSSLHIDGYMRLVSENSDRRKLLEAANRIAKLAMQTNLTLETALADAEKTIQKIERRQPKRHVLEFKNAVETLYNRVASMRDWQERLDTLPSAVASLDSSLNGLQPGELALAIGQPGASVSRFLLSVVWLITQAGGKRVLFFSQKYSSDQIVGDLVSLGMGIDPQQIRTGSMTEQEWGKFGIEMDTFRSLSIQLDDTPTLTLSGIYEQCQQDPENRRDLIVIDDLASLYCVGQRSEYLSQEIARLIRQLKQIAREIKAPILAGLEVSHFLEWSQKSMEGLAADLIYRLHSPHSGPYTLDVNLGASPWRDPANADSSRCPERHRIPLPPSNEQNQAGMR